MISVLYFYRFICCSAFQAGPPSELTKFPRKNCYFWEFWKLVYPRRFLCTWYVLKHTCVCIWLKVIIFQPYIQRLPMFLLNFRSQWSLQLFPKKHHDNVFLLWEMKHLLSSYAIISLILFKFFKTLKFSFTSLENSLSIGSR